MYAINSYEAKIIRTVVCSRDLWQHILSFVSTDIPDLYKILAALSALRYIKRQLRFGHVKWTTPPATKNPLMQRMLDEEWFNADYEFKNNNPSRVLQAVIDGKVIYASLPTISAVALRYHQLGFMNYVTKNNLNSRIRVVVV